MDAKYDDLQAHLESLGHQCKCHGYNGPCRFCREAEQVTRQLAYLDAERDILKGIVWWLTGPKMDEMRDKEPIIMELMYGIQRGDWKKKITSG